MVVVLAHISVAAGREAMFEQAARQLAAATLAREPGIRRYEYTRMSEPGCYQATLAFDDYDAFIGHQASQHHFVLAGAMKDMITTIRLERVDPVPGCSELSPIDRADASTEPTALGSVDDALLDARREHYRERYPLDAATWWGATT
ncbi:MAG: antibiotic biosynthesis monooxygenase family protein [Ilumatobacteraceae bacterium]